MANNQVIVIQVKKKDNNEDRYYNQSDILPNMLIEVGGSNNGTKTTFHVHQSVLQESSSIFGEICDTEQGDTATITIPIIGVSPYIFHHLMFDMYGGMVSNNILRDHAKDIIEAADRFGVEKLKLKTEEMYLEQNAITFDNIMDTLLYSDTKNCTIIKAAVMDCLVRLSDTAFVQQLSFKGVPGHLMKDLLAAVVRIIGAEIEKVKDLDRRQTISETRQAQHDVQIAENRARIAENSAQYEENERTLAQVEATINERLDKTDEEIAKLKKEIRDQKEFQKQHEAEAQAKYRKAILLSFIVGLLLAVTIEYVFACILGYT